MIEHNMELQEFIKHQLFELRRIAPMVCYSYSYEKSSNFHIIEVSPESIRRNEDNYMTWEEKTIDKFDELYPTEDLLITKPLPINNNPIIITSKHIINPTIEIKEPKFNLLQINYNVNECEFIPLAA